MQGLATCWYHGYPYSPSFITIGNVHEESIGHRVGGNRSSGFRRWVFPEAMREDEMATAMVKAADEKHAQKKRKKTFYNATK